MEKKKSFLKRQKRIRGKMVKSSGKIRLSVHRSNKHIYAQLIDDKKGTTLVSVGDLGKEAKGKKSSKTEAALLVGEKIAEKAVKKGIKTVAFDRSGYKYHGRVKAVAEGARKGGLYF